MTQPVTLSFSEVAGLLPDAARWIEVRSMLLQGKAWLVGPVDASPPTFVALHSDGDQAVVVGRAARAAILEAATVVGEILTAAENESWLTAALPDWNVERAILFRRNMELSLLPIAPSEVRFVAAGELAAFTDGSPPLVPPTLGDELRAAEAAGTPIAVALNKGCPAAFCYAGSITETLWDVSIDTLEPYRRRGHAMKAVSFLIEYYAARGKQPVWGALASNYASAALAQRLGFAAVDTLCVFSAPKGDRQVDR